MRDSQLNLVYRGFISSVVLMCCTICNVVQYTEIWGNTLKFGAIHLNLMQYIEIWCNTLKCSKLHWSVTNWSVINAMHTHGSMVKCKYYYYYTVKYRPSKFETQQNTVFFGFTIRAHCTCEIQISSVQYGFNFLRNAMGLSATLTRDGQHIHGRGSYSPLT